MALSPGTLAPDFTLKSMGAEGLCDIKLSEYLGKENVVLLFFPLAFTSVCTEELCGVSSSIESYRGLNAKVIGISVDSPFAQAVWAQREKISIPLASDLDKKVIAAYDVVFKKLAEIGDTAARAVFVIDRDGVIRYSEQTPTPKDLPNFEKVREVLATLS